MKHMRKVFALALTLIMALALTVPAFAAEITIDPNVPADGADTTETYTAYKIFDATFQGDDTTGNVAYTIAAGSAFLSTIQNFKVGDQNAFTLTLSADGSKYIVKANPCYTQEAAADLAVALKAVAATTGAQGITSTYNNATGKYDIDVGDKGYYFIVSSLGSKMIVDTLGDIEIDTKNDYPTLTKKIVDGNNKVDSITADRGNTITFEVVVSIPETAVGAITVHDELDAAMTYGSLVENTQVTQKASHCDTCTVEFEISADVVASVVAAEGEGGTVTFQYTATLNGDAAHATAHENDAYLTYSNYTSAKDTVSVFTYFIDVYKYTEVGGQKTGLAGAGFVLKNADNKYYKNTDGVVTWVDNIADATEYMTVDATEASGTEGQEGYVPAQPAKYVVSFEGLKNGIYTVIEKTVPTGYNPLATDPTATINNANVTGSTQIEVLNQTGVELPSTGGIGTTIFYMVGGILMAGAAILLITKKKMSNEQ